MPTCSPSLGKPHGGLKREHPIVYRNRMEMPCMAEPYYARRSAAGWATGAEFDEGLRRHMLSVYNYMALGLVLTGIVAYLVGTNGGALR